MTEDQNTNSAEHPYNTLTPDTVMAAVESLGYHCDARLLTLNSYENRVYQVGLDDQQPLIAKFYRPERWSTEQILEEHSFSLELVEADISVVAPSQINGSTLHRYENFEFALFQRRGGHPPELDNLDNLFLLGRTLGRIHAVGGSKPFQHRVELTPQRFAEESYQLISEHFIPNSLREAYNSLCEHLISAITGRYQPKPTQLIRTHGDCHVGNMLWRDDVAHFVDLDDCMQAPAIQDLWMLLSGDRQQQTLQFSEVLEAYSEFADFDPLQLNWIECLRTMRIMHYSAWLARRWQDPAFPRHFPWFNTERYWSEHILELREQLAAMDEPPLQIY